MKKLFLFIILIISDLLTKYYFSTELKINETIKLNNYFEFIYIQNFGVSFGLFANVLPIWFINLIGFIIIFFLIYLAVNSEKSEEKTAFFIIIIGAISNILDRAFNGYVTDFILIHYKDFYWPAFNLADIYITMGIIMLIRSFFTKTKKET